MISSDENIQSDQEKKIREAKRSERNTRTLNGYDASNFDVIRNRQEENVAMVRRPLSLTAFIYSQDDARTC